MGEQQEPISTCGSVYIIDDDREVRSSLVLLCRSLGIAARPFAAAQDFLDELAYLEPGCVLADIRMPGLTGLDMLVEMRRRDCYWPTIMMSGHGDIRTAVDAMKLGAIEFLEKPFTEEELLALLGDCSRRLPEALSRSRTARAARRKLEALSARERQVFEGVAAGKTSKEMALELGLSPRTVESYRLTMMAKLGAQRLHDVLALSAAIEQTS